MANSILVPERSFAFGTPGAESPYAEVVVEVRREKDSWILGAPRILDPQNPLKGDLDELLRRPRAYLRGRTKEEEINVNPDISIWIDSPSLGELLRDNK